MMVNVCLNSKHSDCNASVIMSHGGESNPTKGNLLSFAVLSKNVKKIKGNNQKNKEKKNKTA